MDQRVFDHCGKSVVRLHFAGGFRGTGFVIDTKSTECLIMTCAHVLEDLGGDETVDAYFPGETVPFQCEMLYGVEGLDLALLQNSPGSRRFDTIAPLGFLEAGPLAPEQDIVLLAFYTLDDGVTPMIQPGTSEGNIIAQPTDVEIVYTASAKEGTSGGPVICSSAGANLYVAGVHSKTKMGNSYGQPVTAIHEFLLQWVLAARKHDAEEPMYHLSIKDLLQTGPRLNDQVGWVEEDEEDEEEEEEE